jgi:hypothetical protein
MRRVVVLLLVVLSLVVFPLAGCSNSSVALTDPIKLVPNKVNLVGLVDITSILQDGNLTGIYDTVPKDSSYPQTFYDALSRLRDEYNIDLMGFQEGIYFADISGSEEQGNYSGIIIEGTFNKSDLISAIQSVSGTELSTIQYRNYDIYTDEAQESAIAFLDDNTFVIGEMQAVKDVIDVKEGAPALSGEVLDIYNKLGDGLIKLAVAVPSVVEGGQLEESASQYLGNLSAFENVKSVGMTISQSDHSLTLDLKLCCTDSDSAQSIEQSINGLITFVQFLTGMSENEQQNQALDTLLNNVKVTTSDTCVDVNITATLTEIEGLIQSYGQSVQAIN